MKKKITPNDIFRDDLDVIYCIIKNEIPIILYDNLRDVQISANSVVDYLLLRNKQREEFLTNPQLLEDVLSAHYNKVVKFALKTFKQRLNEHKQNKN